MVHLVLFALTSTPPAHACSPQSGTRAVIPDGGVAYEGEFVFSLGTPIEHDGPLWARLHRGPPHGGFDAHRVPKGLPAGTYEVDTFEGVRHLAIRPDRPAIGAIGQPVAVGFAVSEVTSTAPCAEGEVHRAVILTFDLPDGGDEAWTVKFSDGGYPGTVDFVAQARGQRVAAPLRFRDEAVICPRVELLDPAMEPRWQASYTCIATAAFADRDVHALTPVVHVGWTSKTAALVAGGLATLFAMQVRRLVRV